MIKKILAVATFMPFVLITFYWALYKYTHYLFAIHSKNGEKATQFGLLMMTLLFAISAGYALFWKEIKHEFGLKE